jgi:hypothetical protein
MNGKTNLENRRFAACVDAARLLSICLRAARRAPASESGSSIHLSAGCHSRGRLPAGSQKQSGKNLMRCGIFRGKVAPRRTQNQKITSKPTRLHQQNYE